jgi:predicted AAA+ superfamily ATPase
LKPSSDGTVPRLLVLLDEIPKRRDWRNYLQGVYDKFHADYRFLATGSGRLDTGRRGGDSFRKITRGAYPVLIAPAYLWLTRLP